MALQAFHLAKEMSRNNHKLAPQNISPFSPPKGHTIVKYSTQIVHQCQEKTSFKSFFGDFSDIWGAVNCAIYHWVAFVTTF